MVSVDGQTYSKPVDRADAAAHLAAFSGRTMLLSSAVALANGKTPRTTGTVKNGSKRLPAFIIPPVAITKANFRQLFNGYLKKSDVCVGEFKKFCVKPA